MNAARCATFVQRLCVLRCLLCLQTARSTPRFAVRWQIDERKSVRPLRLGRMFEALFSSAAPDDVCIVGEEPSTCRTPCTSGGIASVDDHPAEDTQQRVIEKPTRHVDDRNALVALSECIDKIAVMDACRRRPARRDEENSRALAVGEGDRPTSGDRARLRTRLEPCHRGLWLSAAFRRRSSGDVIRRRGHRPLRRFAPYRCRSRCASCSRPREAIGRRPCPLDRPLCAHVESTLLRWSSGSWRPQRA